MALDLQGLVGRFSKNGGGTKLAFRQTNLQSLAVASVEPPFGEIVRAGRRYYGGCQANANAIAPVAAFPTTTAALVLWNGESDGGASYLIDEIKMALLSGTAAAGAAVIWALTTARITAPSAATGYASASASRGGRATRAVWGAGVTIVATTWGILGANQQAAAANYGQGDAGWNLHGRILVPPGYGLCLGVLSGTGTSPLYGFSVGWSELELDLE